MTGKRFGFWMLLAVVSVSTLGALPPGEVAAAAHVEAALIWLTTLTLGGLGLVAYIRKTRRMERANRLGKQEAEALGVDRPPAQHPMVDTSRCIGCGSCVAACPEGGVLGLVGGKATIINGLRCVGHGRCAEACPVEAVHIGLGDMSQREDIPLTDDEGQTNIPGLYIAGELAGLALVKNAVLMGERVVTAIARQLQSGSNGEIPDILIVGAGPAGLSAALTAKRAGLSCLVLDQEKAGGTILQYPRKKMMLTQPVEIPLHGWLKKPQYPKEELLSIWQEIIKAHQIRLSLGENLQGIVPAKDLLEVQTSMGLHRARRVILALGRRGTPRKLGIPGEDKPKVMYKLLDAATYRHERLLVVGGGDSAVEAAVALSRQPGNHVTISYRKHKFFRIKKLNLERLEQALAEGKLQVLFNSNPTAIEDDHVHLQGEQGSQALANDYVFIFAGGIPPFGLLKKIGVAFGGEP